MDIVVFEAQDFNTGEWFPMEVLLKRLLQDGIKQFKSDMTLYQVQQQAVMFSCQLNIRKVHKKESYPNVPDSWLERVLQGSYENCFGKETPQFLQQEAITANCQEGRQTSQKGYQQEQTQLYGCP